MDPINPVAGNPEALNQNPQPAATPAPLTPIPTPVSPEMLKPKRKISPIALILILLLVFGTVGYLAYQKGFIKLGSKTATPTPVATPTITWQTYTNTELGYQIDYPTGATLDVTGAPNKVEINPTLDQRIVINLGDAVNKVTPESVVKYASSPITIAGLPTYIEELGNETDGKYQNYYFAKDNLAFWIFVVPSKDAANQTLLNQTLATFKFLGQTSTSDTTAGWVTYTNSIQKVSFKYPPTWTRVEAQDQVEENAAVNLSNDQAKAGILMLFNMMGIGGVGQTYEGKPFTLDGHDLYRFISTDTSRNIHQVGISTSLTNTLGVFEVNGKTYSIVMAYPATDAGTEAGVSLEKDFDGILSTFKFTP